MDRRLCVLYGSQKGAAQEVAERVWRASKRQYFSGPVVAMDDFPISKFLKEELIVFVCSTTGNGEMPENMKSFWKTILRKNLPSDSLNHLRFCVLGLGDSSYSRFNFAAKKLDKRLIQLGAQQVIKIGLADDQHDLGAGGVIEPWLQMFWKEIDHLFPLPSNATANSCDTLISTKWKITVLKSRKRGKAKKLTVVARSVSAPEIQTDICNQKSWTPIRSASFEHCKSSTSGSEKCNTAVPSTSTKQVCETFRSRSRTRNRRASFKAQRKYSQYPLEYTCCIPVVGNTRTTTVEHFQDVRLIEFFAPDLSYKPGDVLSIMPQNSNESINKLFNLLAENKVCTLTPSVRVRVSQQEIDMPIPKALKEPISLEDCARKYWDITAIPTNYFFELLSHFTTSNLERDKLVEFTTPEGQEDLYNYANRPRRTCLEVMEDFPEATKHIPIEFLFELFQPIKPRDFSIASSSCAHRFISILVAVVNYKTNLLAPRLGLCSNWLASLLIGDIVDVSVRSGSFKFPTSEEVPVIMIGPGTGVAPFRSYIHERVAQKNASNNCLILFFGCRYSNKDFHLQDEWILLKRRKQLTMFCAFSRDQEQKIYVQHVIKNNGAFLWELLSGKKACIYLAGSSKNMPAAVREALLLDVIIKHGNCTLEEAEELIDNYEKSGRMQSETWS